MSERRTLTVDLTSAEYGELLSKLANELEVYDLSATDPLLSVFITLVRTELFDDYYETTLIKKWKERLSSYVSGWKDTL